MINSSLQSLWRVGVLLALLGSSALVLTRARTPWTAEQTPFANSSHDLDAQWRFLKMAQSDIPSGETFTVVARDPGTEMSLYMMAVSLIRSARAVPSSYYGQPTGLGDDARILLIYEPDQQGEMTGRVVDRAADP